MGFHLAGRISSIEWNRALRTRWRSSPAAALVAAALLLLAIAGAAGAQVTIDNDLPAGTLGHWSVDVGNAGNSTAGRLTAHRFTSDDIIVESEVIFEYNAFVDPGNDGGALNLGGTATVAAFLSGDDEVTSSGSFNNVIDWTAVSTIESGSPTMTTVFTFTASTGTLGTLRFHQYLDEDVEGAGNDVLFSRGSSGGGDLELFTVDNVEVYGVSHGGAYTAGQGLANATFAGWAADVYNQLQGAIVGAGATVSPAGNVDTTSLPPFNHPVVGPAFGPNDITSTLAWDLASGATSATIITTIGGVPEAPTGGARAPEIPTLSTYGLLILASLVALFALRRLRA